MPDEFSISKANPIHFRIENGTALPVPINSGTYYDMNYLYQEIDEYYNCPLTVCPQIDIQCWECTDETTIQVKYDTDIESPIFPLSEILWAEVLDENGDFVASLPYTRPYSDDTYWNFAIDFADLAMCDECFSIEIKRPETNSQLAIPWGDNGTFENAGTWNVGWTSGSTPNTTVRSGVQAHSGAWSAQIDTANPPLLGDADLFISTAGITLTAGNTYTFGVYVYEPSVNSFSSAGDEIKWDITGVGGFTDATVLFEKRVDFAIDGQDAWHVVLITFRCGSVTNADVKLVNVVKATGARSIPNFPGTIFIDDFLFSGETEVTQATSENMKVVTQCDCSMLATYYAGDGSEETQLGIVWHDAAEAMRMRWRLKMNLKQFRYSGAFQQLSESDGTRQTSYWRPNKIYNLIAANIHPYMAEILILTSAMRFFEIDGLPYSRISGEVEPEEVNHGLAFNVEMDMELSGFTPEVRNCT